MNESISRVLQGFTKWTTVSIQDRLCFLLALFGRMWIPEQFQGAPSAMSSCPHVLQKAWDSYNSKNGYGYSNSSYRYSYGYGGGGGRRGGVGLTAAAEGSLRCRFESK